MRTRLLLAVLLFLAGCGTSPSGGPPSGQGTGTATTGAASAAPSSPPDNGGCGPRSLVATVRQQPEPHCLRVGDALTITTETSPQQPWTLPASSDDQILRCLARPLADGAAAATCTALRRGTATVTATTAAFAGDPHGPPQSQWQLEVRIS